MDDISLRKSRNNTYSYSPEIKNINKINSTIGSETLR